MNFEKILTKKSNKTEVFLGHNSKLLKIDLLEYPSIVITGETGSGKSILLDQILLQLINKNTSLEMGIMCIDTNGVELQAYVESNYALYSAVNNDDKSVIVISRILKEIDRRKKLFQEKKVLDIEEYNDISDTKLPLLVLAIDDDKFLLRNKDMEKMLLAILTSIKDLGIIFIMSTSDVYNKFFESDKNTNSSVLISFDYPNSDEATRVNVEDSNNLKIGEFIIKVFGKSEKYQNFDFDDSIINKIINRDV